MRRVGIVHESPTHRAWGPDTPGKSGCCGHQLGEAADALRERGGFGAGVGQPQEWCGCFGGKPVPSRGDDHVGSQRLFGECYVVDRRGQCDPEVEPTGGY